MNHLNHWWSEPDHFDGFTSLLRSRGLLRSAQKIMAVICGSSLVTLGAMMACQRPPVGAATLMMALVAVFVASMTAYWLRRWPTRRQSQSAIVCGSLGIAAVAMVQSNPILAAQIPAALSATGAYVAFFHSLRLMAWHTALAVCITTISAVRVASAQDIPTAVAIFGVVFFLNLAMPLAIGGLARAMRTYALRASEDPLTGLLNRRGFLDAITALPMRPFHDDHPYLAVLAVDLDDFKAVNDTHGHTVGDRALVSVADALRRHTPSRTVIGRAGGEEFVIALTSTTPDPTPIAARLCTAIAELSYQITASIGTASIPRAGLQDTTTIQELLTTADAAMYLAKRHGGNRTQHG